MYLLRSCKCYVSASSWRTYIKILHEFWKDIKMLKDIFFYTTLYLLFWQGKLSNQHFWINLFIKKMFVSEIPKPVSLISVNHSQRFKMYCSFPLQDSKFITENMKPFIVLSEEVLVINWTLTKTTSQKKTELVL